MASILTVFLTIDIGPADAILGRGHETQGDWTRTEAGLAILQDVFRSIEDLSGSPLIATWFLRADRLIDKEFGDRLSIFQKFSAFTEHMIHAGHEIGWMPQIYSDGISSIDYEDLETTYDAIGKSGLPPRSVRMGDCFHDNRTMTLLDDLGVRFDSSAIPGREKTDLGWRMDWIGTPTEAYHPSVADYRKSGLPRLSILEVPLSVLPILAPYDSSPLLRYLNPCMRRNMFWQNQNMRQLISSGAYLLLVLHPDEVVPVSGGKGHPLIAYAAEELRFNLSELLEISKLLGMRVSFNKLEHFVAGAPQQ